MKPDRQDKAISRRRTGRHKKTPTQTQPTEALAKQAVSELPQSGEVHRARNLTQAEQFKIMRLVLVEGLPQKTAAEALGRAESTISEFLSKIEVAEDYAAQILKAATPDAAIAWSQIAKTSKNHLAAKDLLLHTGVIKPLEGESGGAKVQILIGQPGAPVTIQSPQAVDAVIVSPTQTDSDK